VSDHCNANGLVDGDIPAGKPCPFADECGFRTERCPTEESRHAWEFSCGAARAFSMVRVARDARRARG
jgi:hypothetical protein